MVAFKVKLHIHPKEKIIAWHKDKFICELPHIRREETHRRKVMLFDHHPGVSF